MGVAVAATGVAAVARAGPGLPCGPGAAGPVHPGVVGLVVAGLLVGVGVRLGNGCTSGHGVCGLSRFSLRSLANVIAFMGAGVVTVFVLRHIF